VEDQAGARALIRTNVEAMQLTGKSRIFRRDATNLGDAGRTSAFGLAFLDPPYGRELGEKALGALVGGGWLTPGAVVVLEERADATVQIPNTFVEIDRRTYGGTQVLIARYRANAEGVV
jgi:16S rRNA (guanine966-N2)-methyltransferase